MSKKSRNRAGKIITTVIAVALIGFGSYQIYSVIHDDNEAKKVQTIDTENFDNMVKENKNDTNNTVQEPTYGCVMEVQNGSSVIGVLNIPKMNLKVTMVNGTSRADLKTHVGVQAGSGVIGQPGSNVTVAGHSERGGIASGYCSSCYFNFVEDKLTKSDEVTIQWKDCKTYTYEVVAVIPKVPANDTDPYYMQPDEGDANQYVTLETCSHGDSNYRSFVKCKLKTIDGIDVKEAIPESETIGSYEYNN